MTPGVLALTVMAWLELGFLPQGTVAMYDNPFPEMIEFGGSYYSELGLEASWGPFFAGGSARIPMWSAGGFNFWPTELDSVVDVGLQLGPLRLGFSHTCIHPVGPYLGLIEWQGRGLAPRYDSACDVLYLRIQAGAERRSR